MEFSFFTNIILKFIYTKLVLFNKSNTITNKHTSTMNTQSIMAKVYLPSFGERELNIQNKFFNPISQEDKTIYSGDFRLKQVEGDIRIIQVHNKTRNQFIKVVSSSVSIPILHLSQMHMDSEIIMEYAVDNLKNKPLRWNACHNESLWDHMKDSFIEDKKTMSQPILRIRIFANINELDNATKLDYNMEKGKQQIESLYNIVMKNKSLFFSILNFYKNRIFHFHCEQN